MDKLNVLMHIPLYSDTQLSGGERTAQDFAEYLNSIEGVEVRVLVEKANRHSLNGIDIYVEDKHNAVTSHLYEWANVVYTHLGKQGKAVNYARAYRKPIFIYMHNTNGSALARSRSEIGVMYNSYFTQEAIKEDFKVNKSVLIRPLLNLQKGDSSGDYITMINLNENKGGLLLREIAEALPEHNFLAVTGGYGKQFTAQPSNVKVLEPIKDMEVVYKQTKLLIMPSKYESFGRTAAEAIGFNIPVLYSNTNTALEEVVGNAGEPVNNRDNIDAWVKGIRWISNNIKHYKARASEQRDFLERQIARDRANFIKYIENITFT